MDVDDLHKIPKKIKCYLVFFCLTFIACDRGDAVRIAHIDYESEKAVGVTFSTKMDVEKIRVFVGEESEISVIGVIVSDKDVHSFTPVIAFTPGQTYTLRQKNTEVLASFTIPRSEQSETVELLGLYPRLDTVPENLLKMYFEFSEPMQEVGKALDFISVTNTTDGLEVQPFLRLESELWNRERTLLTLWLDPGRIKTDLIPNREKGLPLVAGKRYTVAIDSSWKSKSGTPLKKNYFKKFYVGPRDDKRPDMRHWQLSIPRKDSLHSLFLDFKEPMDAFLARETIRLYDTGGMEIKGQFRLGENESVLRFVPDSEWSTPEIVLRIESRLEDLAGNNLNRMFDTHINDKEQQPDTSKVKSLRIRVE